MDLINFSSADRDLTYDENPFSFKVRGAPMNGSHTSYLPKTFSRISSLKIEQIIYPQNVNIYKTYVIDDTILLDLKDQFPYDKFGEKFHIQKIDRELLDKYQICNVYEEESSGTLFVNFTVQSDKTNVYEFITNGTSDILNKYFPESIQTSKNHLQYIHIDGLDTSLTHTTNELNSRVQVLRQIFPRYKQCCDEFYESKKSNVYFHSEQKINDIRLKILNAQYQEIVLENQDFNVQNPSKCSCSSFADPVYSCACYYLRHPYHTKNQIDIFMSLKYASSKN